MARHTHNGDGGVEIRALSSMVMLPVVTPMVPMEAIAAAASGRVRSMLFAVARKRMVPAGWARDPGETATRAAAWVSASDDLTRLARSCSPALPVVTARTRVRRPLLNQTADRRAPGRIAAVTCA